jgi:hypothetical protein
MGRGPKITVQRVVLGGIATVLVACAGVIGIDDRSLDPELSADSGGNPSLDGSLAPDQFVAPGDDDAGGPGTDGSPAPADARSSFDAPTGEDAPTTVPPGDGGGVTVPVCATPCLMASGLNHPFLMTSDSTHVYWTEWGDDWGSGNGSVKACPLAGCGAGPTLYAQGLVNPRGIAVDATSIYFATATYSGVNGGIWSCPLAGCNGNPLLLATAGIPYGLAIDASYVYWSDNDDATLHKVAKGGGTDHLVYDAGDGIIIEPGQIAVDGPFIYVVDSSSDAVRFAIDGGRSMQLYGSEYGTYNDITFGVANDSSHVFFGEFGAIFTASKTVADSGAQLTGSAQYPSGVAVDPATDVVYWADQGGRSANDGVVGKVSADGGGRQVLAASLVWPQAVTVSGNSVYWVSYGTLDGASYANPSTGALYRLAK